LIAGVANCVTQLAYLALDPLRIIALVVLRITNTFGWENALVFALFLSIHIIILGALLNALIVRKANITITKPIFLRV
jgi:uncharacterized membrane protein